MGILMSCLILMRRFRPEVLFMEEPPRAPHTTRSKSLLALLPPLDTRLYATPPACPLILIQLCGEAFSHCPHYHIAALPDGA
jgi:hypothetical protein